MEIFDVISGNPTEALKKLYMVQVPGLLTKKTHIFNKPQPM
jgi:hypothetical protein